MTPESPTKKTRAACFVKMNLYNIAILFGYTQLPDTPTLAALKAASPLAQMATSTYGWHTTWQKQRADDEVSRESTGSAVRDFNSHCVRHHHSMGPAARGSS